METITTTYKGDMLFESKVGEHIVEIAVPNRPDNQDRGPTPPQLFISSLGACVAAVLAHYCELLTSQIDPTDLEVTVTYEKAQRPSRLTDVKVYVRFPYGETEAKQQALLRVAQHCPVHETIQMLDHIDIEIESEHAC